MKHIKRIVTLICILGCVLALVTCAKKPSSIVLMHDKGGNPDYRPFYDQMGQLSKTATGVSFTQSPYPDTATFQTAVRAALPTDKAPDLFTWWSTYRMKELVDAGLLADLTDLWNKHKELPQGLRDAMSFKGKAYALPTTAEYWGIWYNKETFAKYNLSVPTTWDEFMTVCATLKKNGVTPMVQSVKSWWTTFILFEEMVVRQDPQLYVDLCEGKVKYSDPKVKAAFAVWADLIAKGYFTDPATDFFADAPRLFDQGKAAMIPAGSWYMTTLTGNGVAESKCGIFIMPPVNASAGNVVIQEVGPILVGAKAPNLAAAKKVVDWWLGPEGSAAYAKMLNQYPANPKADTSFLPPVKVEFAKLIVDKNYRIVTRYWEGTPSPICEKAVDEFAKFILKPASVDMILADLDKIADEYWASAK